MNKARMRQEMFAVRRQILEREQKEAAILSRLVWLVGEREAQDIFCYVSMNHEVSTHAFIHNEWMHRRIFVPHTAGQSMTPRRLNKPSFSTDKLGNIEERFLGEAQSCCPFTVVPLVAFNNQCYRLGYGGGFYDRYLSEHTTYAVGLAFLEQYRPDLPVEPFDQPLNAVITPGSIIYNPAFFEGIVAQHTQDGPKCEQ